MSTQPHSEPTSNSRRYLTDAQRQAIVAEVAAGNTQAAVAQRFKVHVNTVNTIIRAVRKSAKEGTFRGQSWKNKLYETMVPNSVNAIERSINDLDDIHKAAGTAMAHLKAVGVVRDESSVTVNIFANTQDLPRDWYSRMQPIEESDAPVIDITPEESSG